MPNQAKSKYHLMTSPIGIEQAKGTLIKEFCDCEEAKQVCMRIKQDNLLVFEGKTLGMTNVNVTKADCPEPIVWVEEVSSSVIVLQ
jgi:hypothetical protein